MQCLHRRDKICVNNVPPSTIIKVTRLGSWGFHKQSPASIRSSASGRLVGRTSDSCIQKEGPTCFNAPLAVCYPNHLTWNEIARKAITKDWFLSRKRCISHGFTLQRPNLHPGALILPCECWVLPQDGVTTFLRHYMINPDWSILIYLLYSIADNLIKYSPLK